MESAFLHITSELKSVALVFILLVLYISNSKITKIFAIDQQNQYLFSYTSHKNNIYILITHFLRSNQCLSIKVTELFPLSNPIQQDHINLLSVIL